MPWIYAGDLIESSEFMLIAPGSVVAIENHKGQAVATGYFNAQSAIACRVLSCEREAIDVDFFKRRLTKALALREAAIGVPYYRMVHSEADGLPGLLVDRFADILVVQVGTAGMEALQPIWLQALQEVLAPKALLLRNDTAARAREGLALETRMVFGEVPPLVEVWENGCVYLADLVHGQKTGWFFDQRDNRKMIAAIAGGKTLLDMYSHSGGFGLLAAKCGAARVTMADSSKLALELAAQAAARNGVEALCDYAQGDAFALMEQLKRDGRLYDIVLADPPAFIKGRKDIASGLKGYAKVARLAAPLVQAGGLLFVASCSHHAGRSAFNKAVLDGVSKAGRVASILKQTGAAADHPLHRRLPQSEYLKGILLRLD
jgi:23S rRNA (cytosine1962-C5)-methyltransferase